MLAKFTELAITAAAYTFGASFTALMVITAAALYTGYPVKVAIIKMFWM